jgi:hypothetical protein
VCTCVAFFGTAFRLLSCAIPFWISFRSSSIVWNRTRFYTLLRDWRLITKNELKFWNTSTASADATATTTNMMRQTKQQKMYPTHAWKEQRFDNIFYFFVLFGFSLNMKSSITQCNIMWIVETGIDILVLLLLFPPPQADDVCDQLIIHTQTKNAIVHSIARVPVRPSSSA